MIRSMLLLTLTLLILLNGEWIRAAAQEGAETLWTGEATWTHKHNATVEYGRVSWLRTVKLDFTVDNHRILDLKTLKMFHGLNGSWVFPPPRGVGAITVRHEGSPESDMREVLKDQIDYVGVQMSVKTCAPELSAMTEGVPDNTIILHGVVTPCVVWSFPRAGASYQRLGLVMRIQFPYKHDQTAFNPPQADVPQMTGIGGVSAVVAGLNPPMNPATMKVTLKRKPLELRYEPLSSDQRRETVFRDWTQVTDFYATATGGERMVHGNSRIHVLVDNNDASASFAISRFLTDWVQPIDQSGRRVGRLRGGGWKLDTERARGGWNDVPGERLAQPPNKWPRERYMQEYLVGVKGFPEFGALYFIVVVDTRPNGYRVQMYPAKKITVDEFCAIKTRNTPYQTETTSGTAVVDSGWQIAR